MSHSFFRTKGKNMSVCYSVISTFITKSLLTFFRELHILTVRKPCFRFSSRTSSRYWRGAAHFLYLRANRREPFSSNAITSKPNPVLTTLRTALSSTMRISSSVLMDPVRCNTTPPGVFAICFVAFRIAISAAFAMEGKFFALPPNLQEFCPL